MAADQARDTEGYPADAVIVFQRYGNGQNATLVALDHLRQLGDHGGDGVVGCPLALDDPRRGGAGQIVGGADFLFAVLRKTGQRLAADAGILQHRERGIPVFAQDVGVDAAGVNVKNLGQVVAETGSVQHGARSEDPARGPAAERRGAESQHVDRISDHQQNGIRGVGGDFGQQGFNNRQIFFGQIQPAFSRFLGGPGGEDHHIGVPQVSVVVGGGYAAGGQKRQRVFQVQLFAFRLGLVPADQHQFRRDALGNQGKSAGHPHIAGADNRNLEHFFSHDFTIPQRCYTGSMMRLGVVFGSRSVEHEVSIITATQLMKHADPGKYELVPLYIDKRGRWWTGEPLKKVETFRSLDLQNPQVEGIRQFDFSPDPTKDHGVEAVIFCVHGGHGEDGTLAGLMELADISYAAPAVVAAGAAIDKIITKHLAEAAGIPVTKYVWFTRSEWEAGRQEKINQTSGLEYPLFVKPAGLGSSVGVTKVDSPDDLPEAIELAAEFDERIVVEEMARDCIEVNVSVIGSGDNVKVSVTEQPVSTAEFLSYRDKYERGGKKTQGMAGMGRRIPAPIAPETTEKIQDAARQFWRLLGGAGVARIDFFANPSTEDIFLGEVNAPPGSMAFYLWEHSGLSYPQLIDFLVHDALSRAARKKNLQSSIESNILQKKE